MVLTTARIKKLTVLSKSLLKTLTIWKDLEEAIKFPNDKLDFPLEVNQTEHMLWIY